MIFFFTGEIGSGGRAGGRWRRWLRAGRGLSPALVGEAVGLARWLEMPFSDVTKISLLPSCLGFQFC